MVLKADGTKWACQSCLKGHRVSGCNHTDRELTLVPKKGRPVTQCQHCRAERKKRSAHVSCDCGELDKSHHPKEKCIHLREAEERLKAGLRDDPVSDKAYLAAVAEEQGCCCRHGGKCTCAMFKQDGDGDGDTVTPPHGPAVKPRLETTKSEGSITVFQNGHHKPVHRKNHLAHECGMPYKMPMPRANTEHSVNAKARRSVDSLALDNAMPFNPSAFTPQTSAPFNTERRMSKSEQHSPKIFPLGGPCSGLGNPQLSSIDFSSLATVATNQSLQSTASDAFTFTPLEPMSAVDELSFDPWSTLPSAESSGLPNNNPFGVWPTNPDVSGMAQPALTAASSGTQSEADEVPAMDDMYTFGMPSIQEDAGSFDFDALPGVGLPQGNRRSLPANFFMAKAADQEWPLTVEGNNGTDQKSFSNTRAFDFNDTWLEGPSLPPVTDMPIRQMGGLPTTGRPSSRSLGPGNAPDDNMLQSLFPEFDINGNFYAVDASTFGGSSNKSSSSDNATSAQMDLGPMNEVTSFQTQAWTDGSMCIPVDNFDDSYELDQDFSNPDFSGNWIQ